MKAMIFAAGIGSRLRPFTLHHPKALVEVGGEPMLARVMRRVIDAGASEVIVNVHHFAGQIVDFIGSRSWGVPVTISDESDCLLDTAGGLLKAAGSHGFGCRTLLLHNADIFTDIDLQAMVAAHRASGAQATLLVQKRKSSRCLYFDAAGLMRGWGNLAAGLTRPRGLDTAGLTPLAFGGVHVVSPQELLPSLARWMAAQPGAARQGAIVPASITPFYADSCSCLAIKAYRAPAGTAWHDVGKPETLEAVRSLFG